MSYPLIFSKYINVPLLATTDLVNSAATLLLSNSATPKALSTKEGENHRHLTEVRGNVGIINVTGPIFRYGKVEACETVYGTQHFSEQLTAFENDRDIDQIVFNFNTGGGEATGIGELAQQIKTCTKPTTAYVDGMSASAGYWLASACDKIVAHETALLGSVGVVYILMDVSKYMENLGVEQIEIVSAVSPKKRLDVKSEEGRSEIQILADDLADIFIEKVSTYREVTQEYAKENFGQGNVMIASKALNAKMIDEIGTFEALITQLQGEEMPPIDETKPSGASTTTEDNTTVMTAEAFKIANPTAYEEIRVAAATAERERIEGIYNIDSPHYQAVIQEHMFNGNSSVNDVKVALFDAKEDTMKNAQASFIRGGQETADALSNISTTHTGNIGNAPKAENPLMKHVKGAK